jgi:hypothetical protein
MEVAEEVGLAGFHFCGRANVAPDWGAKAAPGDKMQLMGSIRMAGGVY